MTADLNARPNTLDDDVLAVTAEATATLETAAPTAQSEPVVHAGDALSRRQRAGLVLLLGALVALGPFTIDMYLPAFPDVAADLATTEAAIQLTLTATMIGFGLGQLVLGPLSDAVGRKVPLLVATSIHVLASISVIFAQDVTAVMIGRVFQGIGAAGAAVVAMAMVRDLFSGQKLIRTLARMALVTGLAPVLAPVIGAQVLAVVQWRGVFVFLAGYGLLVTVIAGIALAETLPRETRGSFERKVVAARYRVLLTDRTFIGVLVVGSMVFSALFSYLSSSSFILQDGYGLTSQQFAIVFGFNAVGLVISNQIGARLMRRMAPRAVMTFGLTVMAIGAMALLTSALLGLGLVGVLVPLFFTVAPLGFVMPAVQVLALADHPNEAGTAASMLGAVNFGVAGVISPLVGLLGISVLAMGVVMCGALLIAHLSLWLVVRPRVSSEVLV